MLRDRGGRRRVEGRHYLDEKELGTVARADLNTALLSFNGDYTVKVRPELILFNTAYDYITLSVCVCVFVTGVPDLICSISPHASTAINTHLSTPGSGSQSHLPTLLTNESTRQRTRECGATLPHHYPKPSQGLQITWLIQGFCCYYLQDIYSI